MRAQFTVKVTRKGQITLPKPFRDTLSIKEGDIVYLNLESDRGVLNKPGIPEAGEPVGEETYRELIRSLEKERENWR